MRCAWLEALLFSSVWVAAAAVALAAAAALAMQTQPGIPMLSVVFCGTFSVYNLDRLRDLERDRVTSPRRTAFVTRNQPLLAGLSAAAGGLSIVLAPTLGLAAVGVLAPVLLAGLFHRRLKRFAWWKPFYVSAAWATVVVGLPAVVAERPRDVGFVAAIIAATVVANVIASNVRDSEAASARFGSRIPLQLAAAFCVFAVVVCAAGPDAVRPLVLLPFLSLAALVFFRPGERYGLLVVDGALLFGALLALPLLV